MSFRGGTSSVFMGLKRKGRCMRLVYLVSALVVGFSVATADAAVQYIVDVQPIVTSDDDGSNTSTFFGNSTQAAEIKLRVDEIWAQAGVMVNWFEPNFWDSTWARIGDPEDEPRANDFSLIHSEGADAGVAHPDSHVIDMYFIGRLSGRDYLGDNTAAGLAYVGQPGITMYVGENLPGFAGGRDVVAQVVAHEIGHNLGLDHLDVEGNLMHTSGNEGGDELNDDQIETVLQSDLLTVIPEPATASFLLGGALLLAGRRDRRRRAA